ncbi:hypothetical protein CDAR_177261 [Caerostris darwini]|uniref:Uncharacterized protein n=1 Tax=Caerostris darwini TaxID=1538125 RepID=A0AAV4TMX6_9ARAC|nr:hypothetical protein CDAR_177261 [Caerostris darwini]
MSKKKDKRNITVEDPHPIARYPFSYDYHAAAFFSDYVDPAGKLYYTILRRILDFYLLNTSGREESSPGVNGQSLQFHGVGDDTRTINSHQHLHEAVRARERNGAEQGLIFRDHQGALGNGKRKDKTN